MSEQLAIPTGDAELRVGVPVSISVRDANGGNYVCLEQKVELIDPDGSIIAQSISIVDSRLTKLNPKCLADEAERQIKYLMGVAT